MDDKRKFIEEVTKQRGKKNFKVTNSFGVYDVYKLIRKNNWFDIGRPLKEHEFYTIIRSVNKLLAQELIAGNPIIFPQRMGRLELKKHKAGPFIVNGKLKVSYPIDWKKTLDLWYEDEEARNNKTLIRIMENVVYTVRYNRYNANYNNQSYYQFALNRNIKKALKESIQNGMTDSLWEET